MTIYVYLSDTDEHEGLASEHDRFTDTRPSRPPLADRQVALVSYDHETVAACARMTKSRRKAVSFKWTVTFDEFVSFDAIPFDELEQAVSKQTAQALRRAREYRGHQLKAPAGAEILEAIKTLRPGHEQDLDRLLMISTPRERRPRTSDSEPIVEYERDAVGLALELAGLHDDRVRVVSSWDGSADTPFLAGIDESRVLEDQAINHDARVFGGWREIASSVVGVAVFEHRDRRITIINANRTPIERTLGVDLIYYSSRFKAYVLVQYKRMRYLDDYDRARWHFRPDDQFEAEIARMRTLVEKSAVDVAPDEFRMDERCCFLKMCPSFVAQPFSRDLISGIYLPLAYWDCLIAAGALTGPRGGTVLTYDNVIRYLNTGTFIALVRSAWIGSRGITTEQITELISQALGSNRSLVLAHAHEPTADADNGQPLLT